MAAIDIFKYTRRRALTIVATALCVTACAPTRVAPVETYSGPRLAPPDIVLVEDFAVDPSEVKLDRGLRSRLTGLFASESTDQREREVGRKVAVALRDTLVEEVRKMGLAADAAGTAPATGGRRLFVAGQLLSVDQGNATRRNLIGLGAGRSGVDAAAQLYYAGAGERERLLESFEAEAESSRKPGAAETMGAGAAAGRVAASAATGTALSAYSEATSANVDAEGKRIGRELAKRLGTFFAQQGWIAAPPAE